MLPHNTQDVHFRAKHVERVGVAHGVHVVSSWTSLESSEPYQHVVLTTGSGSTSNHPHDGPCVPVVRDEDILQVRSPADNIRMQQNRNSDDALHNPTAKCPRSSPVLERVTKRSLRAVLREDSSDTPTGVIRCSQAPPVTGSPKAVLKPLLDLRNLLCGDRLLRSKRGRSAAWGA